VHRGCSASRASGRDGGAAVQWAVVYSFVDEVDDRIEKEAEKWCFTVWVWIDAPTDNVLTVKFRQPSHEFTFCVGMSFISYSLVLIPLV
jgi:hypothetical protein